MHKFVPLSLCFTVAVGLCACGKSEEPAEKAASHAAEETESGVHKALDAVGEMGRDTEEAASEAAGDVVEKGKDMAAAAVEQGGGLADAATTTAEELIAKVKQYIADNDIDLASAAMEQLRAMKGSLPESMQATIDQLEQMLSGAASGTAASPDH